jgi:hypothetical protein
MTQISYQRIREVAFCSELCSFRDQWIAFGINIYEYEYNYNYHTLLSWNRARHLR